MEADNKAEKNKQWFLLPLFLLNALPLYGVFAWGWQSFDLIFLYWFENVVIGAFMIMRMVVRPYQHPADFIAPLFFAPFFTLHYGMFCAGHGTFVFALFGDDRAVGHGLTDVFAQIYPVMLDNHLFWAGLGLVSLQVVDWIRDIVERGLGCDSLPELMVAPYRRIVVLHITIIASGFALGALDEPTMGLVLLVFFKTAFDVYNWRKDESKIAEAMGDTPVELTPEVLAEMAEKFPEPKVTVNGEDIVYDSFAELKASKHYRMMSAIMRLVGVRQLRLMNAYMDMKIAEEQQEQQLQQE